MKNHSIEVKENSAGYIWVCDKCGKVWVYCYANLDEVNGQCQGKKSS